jgi:hypothetical protein
MLTQSPECIDRQGHEDGHFEQVVFSSIPRMVPKQLLRGNPNLTQKYISKKIQRKLNKDKPSFFDTFTLSSLKMEKTPIKLNGIKELRSESFEWLADIDFEYDGLIELVILTGISLKLGSVGYG